MPRASPPIPRSQQVSARPRIKELVSTYFDTPDCALHRLGVYVRIRESGGRYVQTIKSAKSKTELLERLEWEREIPNGTLDLDGLEGTALEPLLTPEIRAALQPVFETRVTRHVCRVEQDGSEIEVAIDRGEIATRTHTRPISELELELKRGEKQALFRSRPCSGRDRAVQARGQDQGRARL